MARPLTFLSLPLKVREQIYDYAGLIRECPLDLTSPKLYITDPAKAYQGLPHPRDSYENCYYLERFYHLGGTQGSNKLDCICPRLPFELLLVSKAIHKEVAGILYGKSKFVLRGHGSADLRVLRGVNRRDLGEVRSLMVRLNCWPCLFGHEGESFRPGECPKCATALKRGDAELDSSTKEGKEMIEVWRDVCGYIGSAVSVGKLSLTFICDCVDAETGKQVIEVLELLPSLKKCTIRLGRKPDDDLRTLARTTCEKLTAKYQPPPPSIFPWSRLPKEIRLEILNYTHLGAKGTYADNSNNGYGHMNTIDGQLCIEDGKLTRLYDPSGGIFNHTCCFQCTETLSDCCCPKRHPAYSETCTCRELPLELFRVDKGMYGDALDVFYGQNTFDFAQDPKDTIAFLKQVPSAALPCIRKMYLRVVETREWAQRGLLEEWKELIHFMIQNLKVSNLSLVVDSYEWWDNLQYMDDDEERRYYYDTMVELSDAFVELGKAGLHDIWFKMGWFTGLEGVFGKRILGERWKDLHGVVKTNEELGSYWAQRQYRVPDYHERREGDLEYLEIAGDDD